MVTPQQQGVFIPADMPRDKAGNVAYKVGNFFKDDKHPDGLPRPRRSHELREWDKMVVDIVLSSPPPSWQLPGTRYGLVFKMYVGPYFELGYRGHCYACGAYFLEYEWAMEHNCPNEAAFRDATNRHIRDYPQLRKDAKQASKEAPVQRQGIVTAIKNLFQRSK